MNVTPKGLARTERLEWAGAFNTMLSASLSSKGEKPLNDLANWGDTYLFTGPTSVHGPLSSRKRAFYLHLLNCYPPLPCGCTSLSTKKTLLTLRSFLLSRSLRCLAVNEKKSYLHEIDMNPDRYTCKTRKHYMHTNT